MRERERERESVTNEGEREVQMKITMTYTTPLFFPSEDKRRTIVKTIQNLPGEHHNNYCTRILRIRTHSTEEGGTARPRKCYFRSQYRGNYNHTGIFDAVHTREDHSNSCILLHRVHYTSLVLPCSHHTHRDSHNRYPDGRYTGNRLLGRERNWRKDSTHTPQSNIFDHNLRTSSVLYTVMKGSSPKLLSSDYD